MIDFLEIMDFVGYDMDEAHKLVEELTQEKKKREEMIQTEPCRVVIVII